LIAIGTSSKERNGEESFSSRFCMQQINTSTKPERRKPRLHDHSKNNQQRSAVLVRTRREAKAKKKDAARAVAKRGVSK